MFKEIYYACLEHLGQHTFGKRKKGGQHGCQADTRGQGDCGGFRPLLLRFRASELLGQQRGVFRGAAQEQPLVQKGDGERLATGQASECAHRRDCRAYRHSNKREIPQTVAACGRLQRGKGLHRRVAHQQLQLDGQHHIDAQISPVQGIIRLESVQPRRVAAPKHLHQNGSLEMAKRAVHPATRHAWQYQ